MASANYREESFKIECRLLQEFLKSDKAGKLKQSVTRLTLGFAWFSSSTFKGCNAADSEGWSFTDAYCSTENNHDAMYISSFFLPAVKMVLNYIQNKTIPNTAEGIQALYRLVLYLVYEDDQKIVQGFTPNRDSEESVCLVLAKHLFSRLCVDQDFIIDQHYKKGDISECPCGCGENLEKNFGDTSIGSEEVWHGDLDIVLGGAFCSYGGVQRQSSRSFLEVKKDDVGAKTLCRFIAQSVVFSFFMKKNRPELKDFMIPCIGICGRDLVIYMYDSGKDVLLKSSVLHLLCHDKRQMDTLAILCIWMVVNYQCLGIRSPEFMHVVPRSNFFQIAKPKLDVYIKRLRFGCVGGGGRKRKLADDQEGPPAPEQFIVDKEHEDTVLSLML